MKCCSSEIIVPAKLLLHGNFVPFLLGGLPNGPGIQYLHDSYAWAVIHPKRGNFVPLKLLFQQNYCSMETLFHFPKVPVERIKMEQNFSGTKFHKRR